MAKNDSFLITKPEAKFWLSIIGLAVSLAIAFTTLQAKVNAMEEKGIKLRGEYEATVGLLKELNDRTIRLEANQEHMMGALNINTE